MNSYMVLLLAFSAACIALPAPEARPQPEASALAEAYPEAAPGPSAFAYPEPNAEASPLAYAEAFPEAEAQRPQIFGTLSVNRNRGKRYRSHKRAAARRG